jgi:hypothetical protein
MSSLQSKEVAYDLLVEQQETFGQRLDKVKQELKEVSDQKIDIESQLSTKTSDHRELVVRCCYAFPSARSARISTALSGTLDDSR